MTTIETPAQAPASLLLPAGTRLLHIGPPKTGTTTLQAAFHAGRAATLAQGVRYAGATRHSASAVQAVTGRPSFTTGGGSPPIGRWNELVDEVRRAPEPRVVISSEFFADAEPPAISRIVEDLDRARVHVVVTLRPLARILPSQWQQYVQSGMPMGLEDWLDGAFNHPDRIWPTFWRRHRHDELVSRWAAATGPGRLTVVVVDERDHGQVLRVFERLTGLREGTLVADEELVNRSLTLAEAEAIRAFNIALGEAGVSEADQRRVVHFGAAASLKERWPGPDEPRIVLPEWALERAAAVSREIVDAIAASGVHVVGDLEQLAPPAPPRPVDGASVASPNAAPAVGLPPEAAARMALGVLAVGRGWATPRLVRAMLDRTPEAIRRPLRAIRRRVRR